MESNQEKRYNIGNSVESRRSFFDSFQKQVCDRSGNFREECYVSLNGTVVRLVIYDESVLRAVSLCLACSIIKPTDYEYSIVIWKTDNTEKFFSGTTYVVSEYLSKSSVIMTFHDNGLVRGFDRETKTFFCGFPDTSIGKMASIGHLFAVQFHKILKNKSSKLIHGACIGTDGKGVLLCARGGMGKSTLAVTALLKGFEYVSDDYLILDEKDGILSASPIYSIIKLTYEMYDRMRDNLAEAVHIGDALGRKKCVLNISSFQNSFRWDYPIRLCIMPEIIPGLSEPSIISCSEEEKGQAIVRLVHSTISQLGDSLDKNYTLELIRMFKNQDFYIIQLSQDIYANVECLREFIQKLK